MACKLARNLIGFSPFSNLAYCNFPSYEKTPSSNLTGNHVGPNSPTAITTATKVPNFTCLLWWMMPPLNCLHLLFTLTCSVRPFLLRLSSEGKEKWIWSKTKTGRQFKTSSSNLQFLNCYSIDSSLYFNHKNPPPTLTMVKELPFLFKVKIKWQSYFLSSTKSTDWSSTISDPNERYHKVNLLFEFCSRCNPWSNYNTRSLIHSLIQT